MTLKTGEKLLKWVVVAIGVVAIIGVIDAIVAISLLALEIQ